MVHFPATKQNVYLTPEVLPANGAPMSAHARDKQVSKADHRNMPNVKTIEPHQPATEDIDFSAMPGFAQPIASIQYLVACVRRIWNSSKIGDEEGKKDAHFKISQLPFLVVGSVTANIALLRYFDFSSTWYFVSLAMRVSLVFSFICSILEGIYESYWMVRQEMLLNRTEVTVLRELKKATSLERTQEIFEEHRHYFAKRLPGWEESFLLACRACNGLGGITRLNAERTARCELAALALRGLHEKYFRKGDDAQRAKLERRIRPWCYAEIKEELLPAMASLTSDKLILREEGLKKAIGIFTSIETQAYKKQVMHLCSLSIAALTLLSLALMATSCPWIVPLVILIAINTLVCAQYALSTAVIDNKGWKFTPHTLVPVFVRDLVKKIGGFIGRLPFLQNNPQPALPPPVEKPAAKSEGKRRVLQIAPAAGVRV